MGEFSRAEEHFQKAVAILREDCIIHFQHMPLAGLANLYLLQGNPTDALKYIGEFLPMLKERPKSYDDFGYFKCYSIAFKVLAANHVTSANDILEEGYQKLITLAAKINDEDWRRSFLENHPWSRELIHLYEENIINPLN